MYVPEAVRKKLSEELPSWVLYVGIAGWAMFIFLVAWRAGRA